jgi:ABC-type antimicrobial peptide transport system permease subunit
LNKIVHKRTNALAGWYGKTLALSSIGSGTNLVTFLSHNPNTMLRNYFQIALRNFLRNKVFSLIHVVGLSIGLSSAIVVFIIASYELSFDKFEQDGDRIFRVVMNLQFGENNGSSAAVPAPLSAAIEAEVSGVEATIPVMQFQGDATVTVAVTRPGDKQPTVLKKQSEIIFTNDNYFRMMPYEWIVGRSGTALSVPFSTVLTESRAKQYFPGLPYESMLGQEIVYDNDLRVFVTGIVKDIEENTDLTSLEFISFSSIAKTERQRNFMMDVWNEWMAYSKVYVKLDPASSVESVEAQLNQLLRKNNPGGFSEGNKSQFKLQPLRDIHFNLKYAGFGQRTANKSVLFGLFGLASFLLLLGCINFINLSTAQAIIRAKEIGIRKTIGGLKKQIILQFLVETFCITTLATILSLSFAPMILQLFSDFLPPGLSFNFWANPVTSAFLLLLVLLVTVFAGFYPAFVLSGLRPVEVLRNRLSSGMTRSGGIRKVLTVAQFVVAQFFVIAAFMVSKQIHFSMNHELGYQKDAILYFEVPRDTADNHREALRNKIAGMTGVEKVSTGFLPPAMEGAAFGNFSYPGASEEKNVNVQIRWGDSGYLPLYGIQLVAGRNILSGENNNEVVINEAYAKALGITNPGDALGEHLMQGQENDLTIVGVMRDFHEGSTRAMIGPLVFKASGGRVFHVKLSQSPHNSQVWSKTIDQISASVHEIYPTADFNYKFFDETIATFYAQDQNTAKLLRWAMALSIVISCLGLLGLVIYTSETRKKEVGIRKILGASVTKLASLLSLEFVRLVVIASVISMPIAWYAVHRWLEFFAYKTVISWWVFVGSLIFLLLVAMVTLFIQTVRTATGNPVNSLRSE